MIRESTLAIALLLAATSAQADGSTTSAATAGVPQSAPVASTVEAVRLPPMRFVSSLTGDEVFNTLKANPAFQMLDRDLPGSPLSVLVTHTVRPTPGGQAAGLLTAILSGSTLGLIPIVSSERMVLRYEVLLHGKPVVAYQFERKATKASNLWTMDVAGMDKASLAWVKETAGEVATKAAQDPALRAVQQEIAFYFPAAMMTPPAGAPLPPAPPALPAAGLK